MLWSAGWASLARLTFHRLIDGHGGPAFGRRFGMNAIAGTGSVAMQALRPALGWQRPLYARLIAGWIAARAVASLAWAMAFVAH